MQASDIRVFIPSKDYEKSQSFYQALGFEMDTASEELTIFQSGDCTFFLYKTRNEEPASNIMLQLCVPNIDDAYQIISNLEGFDVRYEPIKQEGWAKVMYLWGPSGELWHITELNV